MIRCSILLLPILAFLVIFYNPAYIYISDARFEFVKQFFDLYTMSNLFVGVDISSMRFAEKFDNNIHNSYLMFLANFGLGAVIFSLFFILSTCLFIVRKIYYPIFIISPFLLRMATDTGLFMSIYDLLLFAYFALSVGAGHGRPIFSARSFRS